MDVRNKNVTVVGMGKTSMALVRLLLREGALPFVTDAQNGAGLLPFRDELAELGVAYECGSHTRRGFNRCEVIIPSPGVPPAIEPIQQAVEAGAELIGEIEFAFPRCESKIIAVTGTNGKTTTTELIRHILETCGHTVTLAGNNAHPFSAAVMESPAPEYIVLEMSSYQLELVREFHPWIAIALNVTEDHLGRHETMDSYAAVKGAIFARQGPGEIAVVNADDERCACMVSNTAPDLLHFSRKGPVDRGLWLDGEAIRDENGPVAALADIPLPGAHNVENVLAALTALRAGAFAWDKVLQGLRTFNGVEHRLEHVATIDGIIYVNDSKSTNLDSLKVALESFDGSLVLIAGGRGKGGDYNQLTDLIESRVDTLVAIGEDAPLLEETYGGHVTVLRAEDMSDAVQQASAEAKPGDTVLLSPGCASFDMYANFEERGRAFKAVLPFPEPSVAAGGQA